jgi:hypothetical protein
MPSSAILSSGVEMSNIANLLCRYCLLPFTPDTIPGAIMEGALAHVRDAEVLRTYDFVDVIKPKDSMGWQVKSTKDATPVTWKRAKLADAPNLIKASRSGAAGVQSLGDAIIHFCNAHAAASMSKYSLEAIGFSRLIVRDNGTATYYEKLLCTREKPKIFEETDFFWQWSTQKKTKQKEQLSALHGIHVPSGKKWFAWHGLGENQLHFSGEKTWWPEANSSQAFTFDLPTKDKKLSVEAFMALLEEIPKPV